MKIESSNTVGNIQNIANAAIQGASPSSAVSNAAPVSTGLTGAGNFPDLLEQSFDQNLSAKLKDPEMKKEFDNVLKYANKLLFNENSVLKFSRHEATNTTLVKLVDSKTNEVIREFPPEKILNIIAGIWEVAGLVVNEKA